MLVFSARVRSGLDSEDEGEVARAAPVPVMRMGRLADLHISASLGRVVGSGAGAEAGPCMMAPYEMADIRGGMKRTSMGKSTTTGPGMPECAVRNA